MYRDRHISICVGLEFEKVYLERITQRKELHSLLLLYREVQHG